MIEGVAHVCPQGGSGAFPLESGIRFSHEAIFILPFIIPGSASASSLLAGFETISND